MASVKATREFPGAAARDCYQACLAAIGKAGFRFFKQRDYAWFAIATRQVEAGEVTCNLLTSLGPPACIELNLTAANMEEPSLRAIAEELLEATSKALN